MALTTANGEIDADDEILLFVDCLKMNLRMLVLPDTPNVISVGRRVMEEGFGFYWDPYSTHPYMTAPSTGVRIPTYVEQNCPYLCDDAASDFSTRALCSVMPVLTPAAASTQVAKAEPAADALILPPPAPPVNIDPGDRRDLKAEAHLTPYAIQQVVPYLCTREDVTKAGTQSNTQRR